MTKRALEGNLGYKGERGYSAYEVAVQEGYEGTEEEWINHFGLDLSGYVQTDDVVDDLTHEYTTRPLSAKQGKVLKTAVDTLDNAVSVINQNAVVKGDFAVLTGTFTNTTGEKLLTFSYPEGFNKDNCIFIGGLLNAWSIPGYAFNNNHTESFHVHTYLGDVIYLSHYQYNATPQDPVPCTYKIVLMKIDEEV